MCMQKKQRWTNELMFIVIALFIIIDIHFYRPIEPNFQPNYIDKYVFEWSISYIFFFKWKKNVLIGMRCVRIQLIWWMLFLSHTVENAGFFCRLLYFYFFFSSALHRNKYNLVYNLPNELQMLFHNLNFMHFS